ncbi:hypothetical protein FACS1894196_2350 [Clostridia bacterium]|nr:hypothetical protein FACS1894196_2350 [Clostridia bacterium]
MAWVQQATRRHHPGTAVPPLRGRGIFGGALLAIRSPYPIPLRRIVALLTLFASLCAAWRSGSLYPALRALLYALLGRVPVRAGWFPSGMGVTGYEEEPPRHCGATPPREGNFWRGELLAIRCPYPIPLRRIVAPLTPFASLCAAGRGARPHPFPSWEGRTLVRRGGVVAP